MSKKLETKCESCGYSLIFSPHDQALKCPQCGGIALIPSKKLNTKKDYTPESKVELNAQRNSVHECASCGAKTNIEEHGNGVCPYCGTSNIEELVESIAYKPDGIVPFAITKEEAISKYKSWLKTRKFVPNKLHKMAQLNKMEARYFPCWNFDFKTFTNYSGVGINRHSRTRYRTNAQGERVSYTETYETRHPFSGNRDDEFVDYIRSATNIVSQDELEKLGNYGIENLKVYNTAYLIGYLSSGYNESVHKSFDNAKVSAKYIITGRIKQNHSYDSYSSLSVQSTFNSIKWNYIYLPAYICNFKFNKKGYRFLVNGYTGHVHGKVPRSGWKIAGLVLGILAGITGIVLLVSMFA